MTSHIILDPSKEYVVREGFTSVDSEVAFLRADGEVGLIWVRGTRVCGWVYELYRARGFPHAVIVEELSTPRERLRALIGGKADEVSGGTLRRVLPELGRGGADLTAGGLLSALSGSGDFWASGPSVEHAARWLLTAVDPDLLPLVEAQQQWWAESCEIEELKLVYRTPADSRGEVLVSWLLGEERFRSLGDFPLRVHGWAEELMRNEWERRLLTTRGESLETTSLGGPNAPLLIDVAYEYFIQNPEQLTGADLQRLAPLLDNYSRKRLERVLARGR